MVAYSTRTRDPGITVAKSLEQRFPILRRACREAGDDGLDRLFCVIIPASIGGALGDALGHDGSGCLETSGIRDSDGGKASPSPPISRCRH
jgi:hypothetical protein